ncbi:MAG: Holliday junction branch migration protein RuvA [Clostridiales bacterium]|nr:Holliday junction branch migration protein RuvA [Clostridiales bacterium]HBM81274.1 Holliday junction branch migration protein RuvA [Clostridiaceae bacterium]
MIDYIKGTFEDSGKDYIVIDNNGIGYKIFVSSSTIAKINQLNASIKIYTYFHVREDAVVLFGFLTKDELDMFELLISVTGVGPKAALSILSVLAPSKLALAIAGNDIKSLTSVPGVGSKTANRIILELKDKIDIDSMVTKDADIAVSEDDALSEAVGALVALGYNIAEANASVANVDRQGKDAESIVKAALKNLMK